jgi:hypothetical protein
MFAVYPVMGHIGKSNVATFFLSISGKKIIPHLLKLGGKP